MNTTPLLVITGLALCLGSLAMKSHRDPPPMDPVLAPVHFLIGIWHYEHDGVDTEEYWTPARGGTMFGCSRTMKEGKTHFFEFLRIEIKDGEIHYIAMPNGKNETHFKLVESQENKVVFENKEHDYPQRIVYWKDGEKLCAKIEGKKDGKEKSTTWEYEPME